MISKDDQTFIVALIEEAIDGLKNLKIAIQEDDKKKFTQCIFKLSALREAAAKWMNE